MSRGIVLGVAISLIVIIAGAYAVSQRPQRVVDSAAQKLASAQTQHFHAEISLGKTPASDALLKEATDLTLTLDGSFDRRGEARDSLVSNVTINAKSDSVTLEIAGELRFIDDEAYLFVKKAPAAIPLLARLKDQWAELPRGQASETTTGPMSGPLFTKAKKVGRGTYEAVATETGIVSFMNHIAQILGTQLTGEQIGQLRQNIASVESLPVQFQVTPWSRKLARLEVQLPGSGVKYTISFSDRNKIVNHEAPSDAKPIRDILGS